MHAFGEVQDTPSKAAEVEPGGEGGVGWILHFVPFHLSARRALSEFPTAVQAVWEVHDTASSATVVEPGGEGEGGVGWIVHFVPFHLSATRTAAFTGPDSPTAVHAFGEVHEIASRVSAVDVAAVLDPIATRLLDPSMTATAMEIHTAQARTCMNGPPHC